ncbi:zinc finger protein [Aphanothece sacrum FPU1]|uniref:Zinc finger protein n=1 Tax=Aphanothece sacrum FPU1 TaxID=1920663 RepID=A0A401IEX9_APHSA|nr:zinc finger protein [Aphanothece sacrum FPU1]GBF86356.1 zinc finger protein [Aphanothece sacrum FPU3]
MTSPLAPSVTNKNKPVKVPIKLAKVCLKKFIFDLTIERFFYLNSNPTVKELKVVIVFLKPHYNNKEKLKFGG